MKRCVEFFLIVHLLLAAINVLITEYLIMKRSIHTNQVKLDIFKLF